MVPHKLLLCWLLSGLAFTLSGQVWIGIARIQSQGTTVSVKGIALNGPELGDIRYIQDETGAIALYPGSGSAPGLENVQAGDEVLVTGVLDPYQGLLEISPILSLDVLSSNNPLPEAKIIFPGGFSDQMESEHVRLQCVSFQAAGFFEGDHLYSINHYGGIGYNLYIPDGHPLVGKPIPATPVEMTGILSRYNTFRMLVRGMEDLPESPCMYFTTEVFPAEMETNALGLFWKTNVPCACSVRYGLTPAMGSTVSSADLLPVHSFSLDNLTPATAYYVQASCQFNGVEVPSPVRIFSTVSTSSGLIEVYFNKSTDPLFSTGTFPAGSSYQALEAAMLARIDAAKESIDVAVYNANITDWIDALKAAHSRGVQIRYIFEDQSTNSALSGSLPFPIMAGNADALMHNKFLVIDAELPDEAYVITGSMNWTSSGWKTDFNNQLIIQDQALARAYRTEFEEMWGSSGLMPNIQTSRYGPAKLENTPSVFKIGGRVVESFFTPSQRLVPLLVDRIGSAETDLECGLFILTRDELAAAVKDAWFDGVDVRVIIEDANISGSDFNFLLSQGVPVQAHKDYGLFHHKYAIIDADLPDSDPMVITGSYNWTAAATNENDENLLIIHDATIANLFLQEFEARWEEVVATTELGNPSDGFILFPNPASGEFWVRWDGPHSEEAFFRLWDGKGQFIKEMDAGQCAVSGLSPGIYWLTCHLPDGETFSKKILIH
ncbi:MAG: hypothetical protein IPL49_21440 [Saprospirales bacterium]|nr:hypothetical protein [Saprospirales bacterium]